MRVSRKARIRASSTSTLSLTPAQQHALADHGMMPLSMISPGLPAVSGQLTRMVGMKRNINRLAGHVQRLDESSLTRNGSATGTRVWKRMIFTGAIEARRFHHAAKATR